MRRTKILATLGPASSDPETLTALVRAGADAFRLNFSHGTKEDHRRSVMLIREVSDATGKALPIVQDIQGPKIRVGLLPGGSVELVEGTAVTFFSGEKTTDPARIPITYDSLAGDVRAGDTILMDDGYRAAEVIAVARREVQARIVTGGILKNNKGVNFPGVRLSAKFPTEKDKTDLRFGQELGVDYLAASFVRSAADVSRVRSELDDDVGTKVISKVELREAVDNMDEIVRASDAILVARGDLGVELPVEDIAIVQKRLIRMCNQHGIPVITATQMLESMITNPRPTRAESTDIANAILDGTDGLMLSAETAAGRYPVESVKYMARIAERTESEILLVERHVSRERATTRETPTDAIAHAAAHAAEDAGAELIVILTETGGTAGLMAKYRPNVPILALTPRGRTERQLQLRWGIRPMHIEEVADPRRLYATVRDRVLESGLVGKNDVIVLTSGKLGSPGGTNHLEVSRVRDLAAPDE